MTFVTDVQADEQGCDLFENAGIFQFAAVDGADSRNFGRQRAGDLTAWRRRCKQ